MLLNKMCKTLTSHSILWNTLILLYRISSLAAKTQWIKYKYYREIVPFRDQDSLQPLVLFRPHKGLLGGGFFWNLSFNGSDIVYNNQRYSSDVKLSPFFQNIHVKMLNIVKFIITILIIVQKSFSWFLSAHEYCVHMQARRPMYLVYWVSFTQYYHP